MFPLLIKPVGLGTAISGGVVPTPYQAETTSWINRVQALGGDVTPAALTAVGAFFVTAKTRTYWSKLKLAHLFAGTTTIASAMAPLKHPSNTAASNSGFGSEAYTNTGAGAGIQGNGSNYINHNYSPYAYTPGTNASLGTYSKTNGAYGGVDDVGRNIAYNNLFVISLRWSDGNFYGVACELPNGGIGVPSPSGSGFHILSRVNNADLRYFVDGTQYGINTNTVSPMLSAMDSFFSFASGYGFNVSPRKLVFTFAAEGLTPTEVSNLTTDVNALVAAI